MRLRPAPAHVLPAYLLVCVALLLARLPLPQVLQSAVYDLVAFSPLVALWVTRHRRTPQDRRSWRLVAAALWMFTCANLVWFYYLNVLGRSATGTVADLFFLAGWGLLVAGAGEMVRTRSRGRLGSVLDGAVLATAAGALVLVFVLLPALAASAVPPLHQLLALSYLLFSVAQAGALGGVLRRGAWTPTLGWVLAAMVLSFVSNLGLTLASTHGPYRSGTWVETTLLGAYVCLGAAALRADRITPGLSCSAPERLGTGRLAFLGVALVAPSLGCALHPSSRSTGDVLLVAVATLLIVPLVLARISGLVTERERAEQALAHAATHDPLTGLANRTLLQERLTAALAALSRPGEVVLLAFCDLDGFKSVNDVDGHEAGDRLLAEVADRLRSAVRPEDTVCRQGGDEFLVLCQGLTPQAVASVRARLREACSVAGAGVTGSVGIALGVAGTEPETLLRAADADMYDQKRAARISLPEQRVPEPAPL